MLGSAKSFRRETVTVRIDGSPVEVEIRQLTVAGRQRVMRSGGFNRTSEADRDIAAVQVQAVIECAMVPGTNEFFFEQADFEALLTQPTGSFVDELAAAAMRMLNIDPDEVKKNSEATPNSSSSAESPRLPG